MFRWLYFCAHLQLWRLQLMQRLMPSLKHCREIVGFKLPILITEGAKWEEISELFAVVEKLSYRLGLLKFAIGTYWWTGRFDEARMAADYWVAIMKEEASHHREEFRETLQLLRKTSNWHLGRGGGSVEGVEEIGVYRKASKKKGFLVINYRNAHLTQAYLKGLRKMETRRPQNICVSIRKKFELVFLKARLI